MDKTEEAISKFTLLKERAEALAKISRGSQDFKKWYRDTEVAIEKIFGKETRHLRDFKSIRFISYVLYNTTDSIHEEAYQKGLRNAMAIFDSFIDEISEYGFGEEMETMVELLPIDKVKLLIERFHKIARQLRSRHDNRNTIEIEDEYDVQDLFHALLKIYFQDIRPEEYTPSYAGAASRVDFLLKE